MIDLLNKYYITEIIFLNIALFLMGSFVHVSFMIEEWHISTRIIYAVLELLLLSLVVYLSTVSDKE